MYRRQHTCTERRRWRGERHGPKDNILLGIRIRGGPAVRTDSKVLVELGTLGRGELTPAGQHVLDALVPPQRSTP